MFVYRRGREFGIVALSIKQGVDGGILKGGDRALSLRVFLVYICKKSFYGFVL